MRRYTAEDAGNVHSLLGNPHVMRYFPRTYSRDEAESSVSRIRSSYETTGYSVMAVELKGDGTFAGQAGLLHWDDVDGREDVEVAYMLRPEFWGCGYAIEAARACRDWAFENLGVDRVVSFVAVDNAPSIAVALRNGMHLVHRLDENRFGFPINVYAIERGEWAVTAAGRS
ncbi:MAG: GNAT family N-acetyltransferase [Candidatus Eremiobacteraeota bacterium]|nr:GNAT family N-acetyltransferase [Candidatus Eremiobacteraeota bacterium]